MHNIFDQDSNFNKIYTFIGNTVTVGTGIISILSWIVRNILKNNESTDPVSITSVTILTYVLHFSVVLFIIAMGVLIIRTIYIAIKSKSEMYSLQKNLANFIHIQLIHKIRNNLVELEPITVKLNKFAKIDNSDAINECYESEIEKLRKNLKEYVDCLAKYLTSYRKSNISVCIKIFKTRDRNRKDFEDEEIITFVRSENTEKDRNNNNNKTFVGQNTDFSNLCKGQIIFFASSNLHKIKESGQYINDSKNFKKHKYTSTLVAPIRYNNNDQNNTRINKSIRPDIIGFLCIDSKDKIEEWESPDSFELQLLAIFSDVLYVYIKEFYKCFENSGLVLY